MAALKLDLEEQPRVCQRRGERVHSSKAWGCKRHQHCRSYGHQGQDQGQMSPEEDHRSLVLNVVAKEAGRRDRLRCGSEL